MNRSPLFYARTVVLILAIMAVALMLASGPATRAGLWTWQSGFASLRYGTYMGLATVAGAVILLLMLALPRFRVHPWVPLTALVLGVVAAAPGLMLLDKAKSVPPIHDVSTDLAEPPGFVALAEARKAAPNGLAYGGEKVAVEQRKGYPDLKPLVLQAPPVETVQRAIDAARALGWTVAASDAAAGRIEATETTTWFGFKDDVVVRIRPEGGGSRVDVRSVSRVGGSDLGANAERIRRFLAKLA